MRLGIRVAKAVVMGDYATAYQLVSLQHLGWSVAEARAITGASRYAQKKYGAPPFPLFPIS